MSIVCDDDPELIADPRFLSGYRYVYRRPRYRDFRCKFRHGNRLVSSAGFSRASRAALWVIDYFRDRYGDDWLSWMNPKRRRDGERLTGPGWVIRPIDAGEYLLEVCPCGVWCRVEYVREGRKTDVFPSESSARKSLDLLHARVWPLFGKRILDAAPYRTPRRSISLPATIG